jgi:hypothetical protein
MSLPWRSSSMPPLFPGLNSASVRIHATSSRVFIWKPLISPLVTLIVRTPSGKPKAKTREPGRNADVLASGIVGKRWLAGSGVPLRSAVMRTSARSRRVSARTTRPT